MSKVRPMWHECGSREHLPIKPYQLKSTKCFICGRMTSSDLKEDKIYLCGKKCVDAYRERFGKLPEHYRRGSN